MDLSSQYEVSVKRYIRESIVDPIELFVYDFGVHEKIKQCLNLVATGSSTMIKIVNDHT